MRGETKQNPWTNIFNESIPQFGPKRRILISDISDTKLIRSQLSVNFICVTINFSREHRFVQHFLSEAFVSRTHLGDLSKIKQD